MVPGWGRQQKESYASFSYFFARSKHLQCCHTVFEGVPDTARARCAHGVYTRVVA